MLWFWSFMFCFESIKHTTEIGGCFVFLLCFKFGFLHLCACFLVLVSIMLSRVSIKFLQLCHVSIFHIPYLICTCVQQLDFVN